MKKILYLGKPDQFILGLERKVKSYTQDISFEYYDYNSNLKNALIKATSSLPDLIFLFPVDKPEKNRKFIRDLSLIKGEEKIPIFTFIPSDGPIINFRNKTVLGNAIYFQQSQDQEDIVFVILTLIKPDLDSHPKRVTASIKHPYSISQFIWVNYLSKNNAKIESNRDWGDGTFIKFDWPYEPHLIKMPKYKIGKKSQSDSQHGFRYNYILDYQYNFISIKPDERSSTLTDLKYQLQEKTVNEIKYAAIQQLESKPKSITLISDKKIKSDKTVDDIKVAQVVKDIEECAKALVFNWILNSTKETPYYKDFVTIYDQKYFSLWTGLEKIEKMNVEIIHRNKVFDANAEILRDKPAVIAISYDNENNFEKLSQLVRATTQHRDYFPFLLIFNFSDLDVETLRHSLQYHFIIATKADFSEGILHKMLELYRTKKMEKELKKASKNFDSFKSFGLSVPEYNEKIFLDYKIYNTPEIPVSLIPISLDVEFLKVSEFEIVFRTEEKINMGEIFYLDKPFKMNLLIVPHAKGSKESAIRNCYRGLIHCVEIPDKNELRKFLKEIEKMTLAKGTPLSDEESIKILKNYVFS